MMARDVKLVKALKETKRVKEAIVVGKRYGVVKEEKTEVGVGGRNTPSSPV